MEWEGASSRRPQVSGGRWNGRGLLQGGRRLVGGGGMGGEPQVRGGRWNGRGSHRLVGSWNWRGAFSRYVLKFRGQLRGGWSRR